MPESERPVIFKGGDTKEGREGRVAETVYRHNWDVINRARGNMLDALVQLEAFKERVEGEVRGVHGSPEDLKQYLVEIERIKNGIRDESERVRSVAAQNPDLATELAVLDQYVTTVHQELLEEINARMEQTEFTVLNEGALLDTLKYVPPPPPPPAATFDPTATQRFRPEDLVPPPAPSGGDEDARENHPLDQDFIAEKETAPQMDLETYEQSVWAIIQDTLQIGEMLKAQGSNPKVRDAMLADLAEMDARLKELDEQAGHPKSKVREDVTRVIKDLGTRWGALIPSEPPQATDVVARTRRPKGSSFMAWMPRVPQAPYVTAVLAATPPPPVPVSAPSEPAPDSAADLEQLLVRFRQEFKEITQRHEEVMEHLNQQVRERKLAELRGNLNAIS